MVSARLIPPGKRNNTISEIMVVISLIVRIFSLPLMGGGRNDLKGEPGWPRCSKRNVRGGSKKPKSRSARPAIRFAAASRHHGCASAGLLEEDACSVDRNGRDNRDNVTDVISVSPTRTLPVVVAGLGWFEKHAR